MDLGGPHRIGIGTERQIIDLRDVHCGDSWLCRGQSTMDSPVSKSIESEGRPSMDDKPSICLLECWTGAQMTALARAGETQDQVNRLKGNGKRRGQPEAVAYAWAPCTDGIPVNQQDLPAPVSSLEIPEEGEKTRWAYF